MTLPGLHISPWWSLSWNSKALRQGVYEGYRAKTQKISSMPAAVDQDSEDTH